MAADVQDEVFLVFSTYSDNLAISGVNNRYLFVLVLKIHIWHYEIYGAPYFL